jgi:uncharacterized hydantoinase/oxoprolinase family protein
MDTETVRIEVGYDLFRASLIEAACKDAGLEVRLMKNLYPETGGLSALEPSYLLVLAADQETATEIVRRNYPA